MSRLSSAYLKGFAETCAESCRPIAEQAAASEAVVERLIGMEADLRHSTRWVTDSADAANMRGDAIEQVLALIAHAKEAR